MANSPGRTVVDVGSVIADTYQLEAVLGRGGMGAVFLASHRRLAGRRVAIKILHTELEDADIVARFKREAEIAAKLNHPNIVGVIDYNVSPEGMPYLVLDYLEGETLAQKIARGPLPIDQVLSILRQVGSGLAAAHRAGIVHRDLKPQNIFLVPTEIDGRIVEIAKVLDFGISKIRGSQTVKTQEASLLGTPQYMAPEQATGQHSLIDERTDVFALGAIVYEMVSGTPAFSGASIPEVVFKVVYDQPAALASVAPHAPAAIVEAVARAMAKPQDERFATVTAFVEAVTGQPLHVTRGAFPAAVPADSPSRAGRVATRDAFAQTVGPATGTDAVNPMLATMAPDTAGQLPSHLAHGTHSQGAAPGIASGTANAKLADATAGTAYAGATPAAAVPTVAATPGAKAKRPIGMIVGAVVLAAAVAAGAVVLMSRSPADHTPPTAPAPPVATTTPPAPPVTPPAPPAQSVTTAPAGTPPPVTPPAPPPAAGGNAASAVAAKVEPANDGKARPTGKPHTPATKPATPPAPPSGAGDDDGDEETRAKFQQARAALDSHHYDQAEQLANALINTAAGPKQRATAHLIHGLVQCAARNDQEAAQIDLRSLQGFPGLRARLLNECRRHGVIQ
ncbi:MAG TPA: serine/threonine-protein kinase [Kofleriaceae bacterium]|nr:serine/threonine-protein kinase [Kofleriaceae bacterium]